MNRRISFTDSGFSLDVGVQDRGLRLGLASVISLVPITAFTCGAGRWSGGLGVVSNIVFLMGKPRVTDVPSLITDTVTFPSLVITEM